MGDQYRVAQPRGDRRGGMARVDHERAAADRGAVDPFRSEPEIMRDRGRGLAGGGDAINVGRLEPGIDHRIQCRVGMQLDLRHVGDGSEPGGLGGADDGDRFRLHGDQPRMSNRLSLRAKRRNLRPRADSMPSRLLRRLRLLAMTSVVHAGQLRAGRNSGSVIWSSSFSNATSTGMSSCNASGVCGHWVMLVIMRGPSSNSTTAIA